VAGADLLFGGASKQVARPDEYRDTREIKPAADGKYYSKGQET
jgi:hypothetical protein